MMLSRPHILVVEDDPLVAEVIAAALDDDYATSLVETSAGALAQLAGLCKAVTTEFENVPADSLEQLARDCAVSPRAEAATVPCIRPHTGTPADIAGSSAE